MQPPGLRNIAVVTGTRAEFGLLTPVMRAIAATPALRLTTVVTGTHLVGGTWEDIGAAGFRIDARVRMQHADEARTRANDARAVGRGMEGFAGLFERIRPDVVLVLGDRVEAFAAASAASIGGTRVAHIHGGDRAEGVADEAMRHAVTKLAHLHFPATAGSRERILRMGEDERFVWNVGSPAVDGLDAAPPLADGDRARATVRGGLTPRRLCEPAAGDARPSPRPSPQGGEGEEAPEVIVMQHPIGAGDEQERAWARQTVAAMRGRRLLVLAPNHDAGRDGLLAGLKEEAGEVVDHLPRHAFLALLRGARAIVGNSSAGLIEAAALRVPCVNIGPRQAGRERGANVVDCDYGEANVRTALAEALSLDLSSSTHPYGDGRTGERVARLLASIDLDAVPLRKRNSY